MNIKRYDFEVCEEYANSCPGLFENANGEYVEYEDHKKAIETLSRAFDAACEALGKSPDCPSTDILYSECALPDSGTCTACWRGHLLAKAEQGEREEG